MEAAKDEVKAEMTSRGVEEMTVSCFKVRYKDVTSRKGKKYIEEYTSDVTMTQTGSNLVWSNVKKEVNTKDAPCYTRWECAGDSTGHAMVLCGYRYKQEDSTRVCSHKYSIKNQS